MSAIIEDVGYALRRIEEGVSNGRRAVILTYYFWTRRLTADTNVVGDQSS